MDYVTLERSSQIIGTRTWGGLIGMSGAPQLIDGGTVTVPTFRMYDPDGKWFKENHERFVASTKSIFQYFCLASKCVSCLRRDYLPPETYNQDR